MTADLHAQGDPRPNTCSLARGRHSVTVARLPAGGARRASGSGGAVIRGGPGGGTRPSVSQPRGRVLARIGETLQVHACGVPSDLARGPGAGRPHFGLHGVAPGPPVLVCTIEGTIGRPGADKCSPSSQFLCDTSRPSSVDLCDTSGTRLVEAISGTPGHSGPFRVTQGGFSASPEYSGCTTGHSESLRVGFAANSEYSGCTPE